jgi:hypothetical protein
MKQLNLDRNVVSETLSVSSLFDKVITREDTKKILGSMAFFGTTVDTTLGSVTHACDPCGLDMQDESGTNNCVSC